MNHNGEPTSQRFSLFATLAVSLCCLGHQLHAQSTWDGSAGGSWAVATNWTPDLVPTLNDDATINAGQPVVGTGVVAASRALVVGDTATGSLRIENGGVLGPRDIVLGNQAGSNGSATVTNATLNILASPAAVGRNGVGTLDILAGGTVDSFGRLTVGELSGSNGAVTVDGVSSELVAQAGIELGDPNGGSASSLTVRNSGKLTVSNPGVNIQFNSGATALVETAGTITADIITTASGSILTNHSLLDTPVIAPVDLLANFGTLTGSGTQNHNLLDQGVLAPNAIAPLDETGVYTINGSWDQQDDATLEVHLGGLFDGGGNKAFTNFDWVDAVGDVTLAGKIDVQLTAGFSLAVGQQFEIINVGGTLSGTFLNTPQNSIAAIVGGFPLRVDYTGGDGNDVVLFVSNTLEADFDGDMDVDGFDLAQWQGDYNANGMSDANGDGRSDGLDFLVWQQQSGIDLTPLVPAIGAVPEPTCAALVAGLVVAGIAGPRSRRR